MGIKAEGINKTFGEFGALKDVNLTIPAGDLVALLGPSGSGKTTLLRIIAGLEQPDPGSGPIRMYDEDVADLRVQERRVGFVFQHYALFRHMTVFENIAFGMRVRPRRDRPSRQEIHDRVHRLLQLVQLDNLAGRYPAQLSGGQRQRVALARALAVEPRVLLLDEPFGALDAKARKQLRSWLRHLHKEINVTSIFVTHDQDEALEVANRVVVMNQGRIEQDGTPDEVFHHPASEFVMNFLGDVNVFHGRLRDGMVAFSSLRLQVPDHDGTDSDTVRIFFRPHDLVLDTKPSRKPHLLATIDSIHSAGPTVRFDLVTETGTAFFAEISQERYKKMNVAPGDNIFVSPREFRIFTDSSTEELES